MTPKAALMTVRGKIRETLFPDFKELRDQLRIERAKTAALEAQLRWMLTEQDRVLKQTVKDIQA